MKVQDTQDITLPKMVKCILIKVEVGNLEKLPIVLVLVVYELESILNGYKFLG